MQNKSLIRLLEQLNPEDEICVKIFECLSGTIVDFIIAVGYDLNAYDTFATQVTT
ncbi:hypothetical protein [Lacrimispora sp.]|uniref:hypothetical protein n=1 Tax=Lacrimispora sp. TaxID=2719234 RepID=UPI0028A5D1AF|nr:hypothetical protein [Lacrimispora sp.]